MVLHIALLGHFIQVLEENLSAELQFQARGFAGGLNDLNSYEGMPGNEPWATRYYSQSATQGLQIQLVKRNKGADWVVIKPDLSLSLIRVSKGRTISEDATAGVHWTVMPALTEVQKNHRFAILLYSLETPVYWVRIFFLFQ